MRSAAVSRAFVAAACASVLVCASAALAREPLTVYVVRHADKPDDAPTTDVLSTLSAARATALAARLVGAGVQLIVASEARRTQLTAQPLWEAERALGREPRRCLASDAKAIARLAERSDARALLVVTLGNLIDDVIRELTGRTVPEVCACEYDRLYRVDFPSGAAPGHGELHLETFGALPLGPNGETCSAALPIDPLTCKAHPSAPRAELGRVAAPWPTCPR